MISLKKDGKIIYSQEFGINPMEVSSFLPFIGELMEIEEGTTFETFFNHIMKDKEKYSEFFASQLGHHPLSAFGEEWQRPFEREDSDEMQYLEIYWQVDYDSHDDQSLQEQPALHGIGTSEKDGPLSYSIELTPLNELKAYPLKLNTAYKIEDRSLDYKRPKKIFEGNKSFKVYDVIAAVLYEITFYGTPEQRNQQLAELKKRSEEIDRGEVELIPMEDVQQFFENLEKPGNK